MAKVSQKPSRPQKEEKGGDQDKNRWGEEFPKAVPTEHPGVEGSGHQEDEKGQKSGSYRQCPPSGEGIVPGGDRGGAGEYLHPPLRWGGVEGEEEQFRCTEEGEKKCKVIPKAPGGKGRGVAHPPDDCAVQHLPAVPQGYCQ